MNPSKKPLSLASRLQRSIAKTEAVDGTMEVKILFLDGSAFSFQAKSGDAKPSVSGDKGSLADEFATGVERCTFLAAGVQLAFKDGSSCHLNFGRKIDALPA